MMNLVVVAATAAGLLLADPSYAWISSSTTSSTSRRVSTQTSTAIFSTVDNQGKQNRRSPGRSNKKENEYDLEETRNALEALMSRQSPSEEAEQSLNILTSAGRHRRQLEMDLLRNLYLEAAVENEGEGQSRTVDELMHLWMYEHDADSAMQLEAMQVSCSPGMVLEEEQLRIMCVRFPTWAEPRARLAILLFMKGISDEAYDMALEALELKPWHFEVYPMLVMICLRHDNMGQALYWARRSLPSFRSTKGNDQRRKAWVDQALAQAAEQWEQAERETIDQERKRGSLDGACTSNDNCSWQ